MTDHWCTYCNGVNAHNCQFNPNLPRMKIYTTNTGTVSDDTALLRQALEALETVVEHFDPYMGDNECRPMENARYTIAALRERLGEKS